MARYLLIGFTAAIATVAGSRAAQADRQMLVLIDASGSMSTVRADARTRFEAAKQRALDEIAVQAASGLSGVAVYTFSDATSTPQTIGFVDKNIALTTISSLDLFTVGGGVTPLAGSMCDAVNTLNTLPATTTKILEVASDGEENSTPSTNECAGPFSTDSAPPYSTGSWQNLVYTKVANADIAVQIDLFDPGPITMLAARAAAAVDPEGGVTAKARLLSAAATAVAVGDGPPTLADFFTQLAVVSGGRLNVIEDTAPALPVTGDADGNGCIDRRDAIAVARAFGDAGSPQDNPLDLDLDGVVGYSDYAAEVSRFTPGGCGVADPYTARAPIVCKGAQTLVIDGQAIESGGIAIDARGACQILIKNALIVSGSNALDIRGSALIAVQNSILVGQRAVIQSNGASVVIAQNSVFHGARNITGVFSLIDLGGNTFE